jgi:predicted transcriptional regulator
VNAVNAPFDCSDDAFRDAFLATHAQLTGVSDSTLPVSMLLTSRLEDVALSTAPATTTAPSLPLYRVIPPTESLANTIRAMIKYRTRRVIIQRPADGVSVGVVRSTDVLSLLLREQHVSYR